MKHILTLCVGNICRSPIAEALLKQQFPEKTIWSAGLAALVGKSADSLSIDVAAGRGLDLSGHRAQQLAGWMCQSAELILVMEEGHKAEVEQRYPLVRGKVFRLGKFDIADPYRHPSAAFETAYAHIDRGVADWALRIRKLG
ncbi:MAG: low molecular weight phosphotyrosine protein phosphatase [Polaromonas sp.]|nr:low molecular weight phosphotyrosine protein phosphatase [Polaromonas sp.]